MQLDIAVEHADLASAKATLQEAEVAFQRQADLIAKRVTSEANLDTARAKRDTAMAAVKRIEAVIAQKTIKAPFAGRLGIRKVEQGQYVSPGMVLVRCSSSTRSASISRCRSRTDRQAARRPDRWK